MLKKSISFTLIEVVLVVLIILMIASLIIASLASSRAKGRDIKRVANLDTIRTALEQYKNTQGVYPATTNDINNLPTDPPTFEISSNGGNCADCSGSVKSWIDLGTALQPYLSTLPKDPRQDLIYTYWASASNYRLTSKLENNPSVMADDGGTDPNLYEIFTLGLVGMTATACTGSSQPIDHIIISEVYYNYPAGQTSAYEWIELYNPTNTDKRIDGSIQYSGDSSGFFGFDEVTLKPYHFAVIVQNFYPALQSWEIAGYYPLDKLAKITFIEGHAMNINANRGHVFLKDGSTIIDHIGWGNWNLTPTPSWDFTGSVSQGRSLKRKSLDCETGIANTDWQEESLPTPGW